MAAFVLGALPRRPCSVLEVGAGRGELAAAVRGAGHAVTAIDPHAAPGTSVLPVALTAHRPAERYDAVVASRVLHHLDALDPALDHLAALLRPGGLVVVHEYGPDLLDESTAAWYLARWRQAGRDSCGARPPPNVGALREAWRRDLAGLHHSGTVLAALRVRFDEMACLPAPHLAGYFDGDGRTPELDAIRAGEIRALGYRWVGSRR